MSVVRSCQNLPQYLPLRTGPGWQRWSHWGSSTTSIVLNTLLLLKEPNITSASLAGTLHHWLIQSIKISMPFTCLALKAPYSVFVQLDSGGLSSVLCIFLLKLCVVTWSTFLTCWVGSLQTRYVTTTRERSLQPPVSLINTTPSSRLDSGQKLSVERGHSRPC